MFESLKHWIESIEDESELFSDADDELLHSALASLLHHFIVLDQRHDGKEKHEFDRIMQQDLGLSEDQTDHLYEAAKSARGDLHQDLLTIRSHMNENPMIRMLFLQQLLRLIDTHGVQSAELETFREAVHEVFPELKERGSKIL